MQPKLKVAQVLNLERNNLKSIAPTSWHYRTLQVIRRCRSKEMRGHIDQCDCCGTLHISYNSCRNRHCPSCQGHQREQWIARREQELLNTTYFHVVFTLPSELHGLAISQPRIVYKLLFKAAWDTLNQFAKNPKHLGAKMGMIAVLHTWGQNLSLHPHIHCIVPGGGVTKAGKWKKAKNKGKYLFNVKPISNVFRAKYVSYLKKENLKLSTSFYNSLFKKNWVVYAKRPFGKPQHVIEYLGRYSHKIAISNHRLVDINAKDKTVTFKAKDYRKNGAKTNVKLPTSEFIRRFCLHILPKGFTRIRHYGILSSSWKKEKLPDLQQRLQSYKILIQDTTKPKPVLHKKCPSCKKGSLKTVKLFDMRGPPDYWKRKLKNQHN